MNLRRRITALAATTVLAGLATLGLTAPAQATAAGPAAVASPMSGSATVSPRVGCGGFNGHLKWDHQDISVWGEMWETCGGRSYLYLSWNDPTHWNEIAGSWVSNGTIGIDDRKGTMLSPSNIAVTVCNTHGGWHCGAPQHV